MARLLTMRIGQICSLPLHGWSSCSSALFFNLPSSIYQHPPSHSTEQAEVAAQADAALSAVAQPLSTPLVASVDDAVLTLQQQRAAADRRCVATLLRLLVKAHYVPLSQRDVALAASLNAESLNQLYIQPNTRALDAPFAQLALPGATHHLSSVAVYTRGYEKWRIDMWCFHGVVGVATTGVVAGMAQ